jgi:outer membrane usher protein
MPRNISVESRLFGGARRIVWALGAACMGQLASAAGVTYDASTETGRERWVEVRINEVPCPDFALLRIDPQGRLFVRTDDVRAWGMRLPATATTLGVPGTRVRIDNVEGLHVHLDEDENRLHLDAQAFLFSTQVIPGGRHSGAPELGMPALFIDYNLFAEHDPGIGQTYSGLFKVGSSLGRTSLTSSWLASREPGARGVASAGTNEQTGWHRLDTALLLDWPEYTARLTFGDSTTSPGTLGQAIRFSGVQWATDFATQPGLTPFALPVVSGTATLPSSVELYVNQVLVQRATVNAGPFQLNNIPVPVGQGAVDIRLRDILGNVQQLSVPYLVSPRLLPSGFTTNDLAVGAVREDYGIANFAYGPPFLTAGIQHGWNDSVTIGTSAELLSKQFTARSEGAVRVTRNITADLTSAVSDSPAGVGVAIDTGIDSLWGSTGIGMHFRNASRDFVELGSLQPATRLHTEWAAQASTQLARFGSLSLIYGWRRSYDAPTAAATTLSYNVTVYRLGSLGAFVSQTRSGTSHIAGGITFTRFLGNGSTTSVAATTDSGATTVDARIGRAAPPDSGWGWEFDHARGGIDTDGLRVDARSAYGVGSAEIDSTSAGGIAMISWQGGLLWTGGRPRPAQTLGGPAALVELPDLGGVEVLHDGQPVGRTDERGRILVTALRPFEDNVITINPEDLPLTAMVDSERLTVRPYSHGVLRALFPVGATESQTVILHLDNGALVPVGAELALNGHIFPVGTEGLVQVPVLHVAADAWVNWAGGRCRVRLHAMKHSSDQSTIAECRSIL